MVISHSLGTVGNHRPLRFHFESIDRRASSEMCCTPECLSLRIRQRHLLTVRSFISLHLSKSRSQQPRGLRRRSAAARLLRSWVRIPPGAWMFVCCECCVLSGRGLCDELITRPEESYRLWCVVVCDLETSWMRRPWPALGRSATGHKQTNTYRSMC